jgi:hypothetical protein
VEWNGDLGQYELLSDGATRGQFQQLLRTRQLGFNAAAIRDLFIRRGEKDFDLRSIISDFAQSREISTPDWYFEEHLAHADTVESAIKRAFLDWQQATLPKDAKGKVIYLYLHQDDDPLAVGDRVRECLNAELEQIDQPWHQSGLSASQTGGERSQKTSSACIYSTKSYPLSIKSASVDLSPTSASAATGR